MFLPGITLNTEQCKKQSTLLSVRENRQMVHSGEVWLSVDNWKYQWSPLSKCSVLCRIMMMMMNIRIGPGKICYCHPHWSLRVEDPQSIYCSLSAGARGAQPMLSLMMSGFWLDADNDGLVMTGFWSASSSHKHWIVAKIHCCCQDDDDDVTNVMVRMTYLQSCLRQEGQ